MSPVWRIAIAGAGLLFLAFAVRILWIVIGQLRRRRRENFERREY